MRNFFILFFVFLTLSFPVLALAQEEETSNDVEMQVSSLSAQKSNVDEQYTLPYPGLLPDNPLYTLKTTRDKIVSLLISNPVKKASFDVLQADKRLQAGIMLIQKDKSKASLAATTISKGENYFEEAVLKTIDAEKQGMETGDIKARLTKSVMKHKAVLLDLQRKVPASERKTFEALTKRVLGYEKQVNKLNSVNSNK
jgi:hypothetical protein